MQKRFIIFLLLSIIIFGCGQRQCQISSSKGLKEVDTKKMVDVTLLLEEFNEDAIIEFTAGQWAISVRNLKTGQTYYYDSSNNFLGRKSD